MGAHPITIEKWKVQYALLLRGWKWCSACNEVVIDPANSHLPKFAFKCWTCYKGWQASQGMGPEIMVKDEAYTGGIYPKTHRIRLSEIGMAKFCNRCGDSIDERKIRFALFNSGGKREASLCEPCSRGYKKPANPGASVKVYVPEHWMQHIGEITGVSQLQLIHD